MFSQGCQYQCLSYKIAFASLIFRINSAELVRHTHMLFPRHYREYTYDLFHRVVIHDDNIPERMRKESYRVTASLWEQFFQVAYAPSKSTSLNTDEVELDMPNLQGVSSSVPSTDVEEEKKKGALSRLMSIFQS